MKIKIFGIVGFLLFLFTCKPARRDNSGEDSRNTDETIVKINKILVEKDSERIKAYIKRRNWAMKETETGLWYMITFNGKGKKAETGMEATLNYTMELLDGTLCYSSDSLGPKKFKIGQGGVESGLEEGILLLKEGDKAIFIMPPHLGYGLIGDENRIPARSIIVYKVDLVRLEENK